MVFTHKELYWLDHMLPDEIMKILEKRKKEKELPDMDETEVRKQLTTFAKMNYVFLFMWTWWLSTGMYTHIYTHILHTLLSCLDFTSHWLTIIKLQCCFLLQTMLKISSSKMWSSSQTCKQSIYMLY